jgi:hypothetical protein
VTNTSAESVKQDVSAYLYFGSLYFLTVGVLYMWGYWGRFHVNILEYISVADVLKVAAYPIASVFLFAVIGAVLGEWLTSSVPKVESGAGRDTRIGRFLNSNKSFLIAGYFGGTLALALFGPETKWHLLSILFALPVYLTAKNRGLLADILPHDAARSIVLYLLAVLPTTAYALGRQEATRVLEGREYQYLTASTSGIRVPDLDDAKTRIRYVGHVNDYVFLLLPDNVTLAIVGFDKEKGIQLRHFTKASDEVTAEGPPKPQPPNPKESGRHKR